MRHDEKKREYRKQLVDLLDYVEGCSRRNVVPLMHDVNIFRSRLFKLDRKGVDR